jgi:ubiquinone/menaquinone biosynthesis C-methylase UbiE
VGLKEQIKNRYGKQEYSCNLSCSDNKEYYSNLLGRVLDIGCGALEKAYASIYNAEVHAIDINDLAVKKAKEKAEELYKGFNISFYVADMEKLPFGESFFDAAFTNCVINHSLNKALVLGEVYRVLKIGGEFIISDAFSKDILPIEIRTNPELVASCFGGAERLCDYKAYLEGVGFKIKDIKINREYKKNGFGFLSATIFSQK